jgi:hypothetical protein
LLAFAPRVARRFYILASRRLTSILFSKATNYPETIESLSSVLKKRRRTDPKQISPEKNKNPPKNKHHLLALSW